MLNFYIEIQLQSTDDVPIWFIMSKAYGMIHKSLGRASANGKCPVGVSFPHMDEKAHEIGDIIRLFAEDSETLNAAAPGRSFALYGLFDSVEGTPCPSGKGICYLLQGALFFY